jgi:O-antigen/teichoic acid export membrane protein
VVTIALVASGAGYWGLVWGAVAGSIAGALVCWRTCPYPMRLRFERQTLRDYASFSWPLFGFGVSRLAVVQGSLLVANYEVGLAGVAVIGLASNIAAFTEAVDNIVSQTIYPAVCRIADRIDVLAEAFVKSNRLALMWAMPFAGGLALFAGDLVHFVLGERWHSAIGLLIAFGLTSGFGQLAFNWTVFLRAVDDTKPIFIAAVLELAVFFAVSIPAIFVFGVAGYAAGFAATTIVQIAIRAWYMRRLFRGFAVGRQMLRAIAPTLPAAAVVGLGRLALGGERTAGRAIAEIVVYSGVVIAATWLLERPLIAEIVGYVRGRQMRPPWPPVAPGRPSEV